MNGSMCIHTEGKSVRSQCPRDMWHGEPHTAIQRSTRVRQEVEGERRCREKPLLRFLQEGAQRGGANRLSVG